MSNEQPLAFVPVQLRSALDHISAQCPGSVIHINYDGCPKHISIDMVVPLTQEQRDEYVALFAAGKAAGNAVKSPKKRRVPRKAR
jgi:hypothetical protein